MGEIVSAYAASHAPQILVRPKNEQKEWSRRCMMDITGCATS